MSLLPKADRALRRNIFYLVRVILTTDGCAAALLSKSALCENQSLADY